MLPEFSDIEPKLKEVLYNCLEQIRATKAALYLSVGDQPYSLVTQYGFKEGLRKSVAHTDALVDLLLLKRAPFFVNSIGEDSRFAEILDNTSTSRMLVAPIYLKGKLYGFVDMRDKAAGKPFDFPDSDAAQAITHQFIRMFSEKGLFGLTKESVEQQAMPGGPESPRIITSVEPTSPTLLRASSRIIDEAKRYIERGGLRVRLQTRTLTEQNVNAAAVVLPGVLSIPGVVLAAISSFSELGGHQVVAARSVPSGEALEQFQSKLKTWQQKRNEPDKLTSTSTEYPFGKLGTPIAPDRLVSTLSAPVRLEGVPGVVLTIAFDVQPGPETKAQLEQFLTHLEQIVSHALAADDLHAMRNRIAQKLVEPDVHHYPHLKNHSERVAELAERLALFVGLEPAEVEKVRLAAQVHDVGMRLLDYANIYRKPGLTTDDMESVKQHTIVGAAVVADSPLGPEIANLVLHHHERPDGTGYPNGILAEEIPLGSRIIHICEAFDAMTASDSYQTPVPVPSALGKIRRSAGAQFDAGLSEKFVEMMSRQ